MSAAATERCARCHDDGHVPCAACEGTGVGNDATREGPCAACDGGGVVGCDCPAGDPNGDARLSSRELGVR